MRDLEMTDSEVNEVAGKTAKFIIVETGGDLAAQLGAAMGALMWITREHGMRDGDIVALLAEMYVANPRSPHA